MSTAISKQPGETLAIVDALIFCRGNAGIVLFSSVLVLIPCFWHRHIEAGDLASHTYNVWLAQLIAKGQAPGLYIVPRWNNILFDISLYHLGNFLGLPIAEKVIVSAAVLLFFWGVFSFLAAVTGKPPWCFMPCIAMLAYGYAFSMGFINYYLSIGLACVALAMLSRNGARNWICAAPVAVLALIAHPIGFLWLSGTVVYVLLWRRIPGLWRLGLPAFALAVLIGLHVYIAEHPLLQPSWPQVHFYMTNGADQLIFYGHRYAILAYAALAWGVLCFVADLVSRVQGREADWQSLWLLLELYAVSFCVTALIPEDLHTSLYAGWIGYVVSRLTVVSGCLGLAVLNSGRTRNWFAAGFAACAVFFFLFLFQDTLTLNRLEDDADRVVATLPSGSRVVPVLNAPDDWRAEFIYHSVERACIGRCFSYANYEPASQEFRVRVQPGSPIVTSSSDEAEAMARGDYLVKTSDPPLTAIYQCDDSDFTKLCAITLQPGETEEKTIDSADNQTSSAPAHRIQDFRAPVLLLLVDPSAVKGTRSFRGCNALNDRVSDLRYRCSTSVDRCRSCQVFPLA
jgi:hypothetical protein